ncbi:MAG TPA: chemotaxis protein CheW [Leptospiraceae bacterium]|nr:chemotaxis protein CheW [Leptospiraceae bacterium]HMW59280.1 chemotaxis protein CheW [Leptospiraceae bacterium]HNE23643.1 chemotaxis protein CheW [Leptospiraceae bacterium]HNJ35343.1 chemotaxis protein CheW [Leptospiraceae bacterium]HQI19656.1 chemotaxis protein CheW [Leptospiraceae bacterium]
MNKEIFSGHIEGLDLDSEKETELVQFLVFQCGDGIYGINILDTHEILKPVPVTRLPNVDPEYLGVLNLRGNIIPLLDANRKFGDTYSEITNLTRIVVCASGGKFLGILVDRILEVARLPSDRIEGREVSGLSHQYVSAVGRSDARLFLILNLQILSGKAEEENG